MWKQRAVTLCRCMAILSPVVGCAYAGGGPPQAYMPGPDYAPAPAYLPAQAYAPVATVAAQPADSGAARVYAIGPNMPAALSSCCPAPGKW